jgi:hypothetical protein
MASSIRGMSAKIERKKLFTSMIESYRDLDYYPGTVVDCGFRLFWWFRKVNSREPVNRLFWRYELGD